MLEVIIEKMADTVRAEEGDFVKDGLLYCGKCGHKKQVRFELPNGKILTPRCMCRCEIEAEERRKAEEEELAQRERIEIRRKQAFPDREMMNWTFENDDGANAELSKVAMKYTENFGTFNKDGKGLLLYGQVGTGKTYISACIANELIDGGYTCLVTNFARLTYYIDGIRGNKQSYLDDLNNEIDLLVIDDLASERDTEYMGEIVQNIIDARYRSGKPIIVTTNLTGEELKSPADMRKQRIYSRLFEMCIPYEVKGVDRRKEKLKEDYQKYKELLGIE